MQFWCLFCTNEAGDGVGLSDGTERQQALHDNMERRTL